MRSLVQIQSPRPELIGQNAGVKIFQKIISAVDSFQKAHRVPGFAYAVIKKHGEDNGSYQAALLTYYGFLSLFPLLLVAFSVLKIILHSNPHLQQTIIKHVTQYIPVVGQQLQTNVHSQTGNSIALIVGILLTLWGAKGIADVFQHSLNQIWEIPQLKRPGFPKKPLKSLLVIILGGLGLVIVSFLSGYAAGLNRGWAFRIVPILVSLILLVGLFWALFRLGLARMPNSGKKALLWTAVAAAIGIQILQIAGGYLVTHQLSKFQSLYGTFAATLGLLFWIFLQARVMMYAAEIGSVYDKKLWPRGLTANDLTSADRRAYSQQAKKEKKVPPEDIDVEFNNKRV